MALYSVMTGPGPASGKGTQLVRHGVSWIGLYVPELWLLAKGMWPFALLVIAYHISIGVITRAAGLDGTATTVLGLAPHLLVALEGRGLWRWHLERKGYREAALIAAGSLEEAEYLWFSRSRVLSPPPPGPAAPAAPGLKSLPGAGPLFPLAGQP